MTARFLQIVSLCCGFLCLGACVPTGTNPTASEFHAPTPGGRQVITPMSTALVATAFATAPLQPPTPAATATPTRVQSTTPSFVASLAPQSVRNALFQAAESGYEAAILQPGESYSAGSSIQGPINDAALLAFAHFADRVAYWQVGPPATLSIADLEYQHPQVVFTDSQGKYASLVPDKVLLEWSPDDQHLMVDIRDDPKLDLIYHLTSRTLEPWPWVCDRVAVSPRTGKLATWCVSTDIVPSDFAVMEWGGQIWFANAPPATEVIRRAKFSASFKTSSAQTWAWSSDGQRIAYFDPATPTGYLIADASGVQLKILPDGLKPSDVDGDIFIAQSLSWSQDGRRLLALAYGTTQHPCPPYHSPFALDPNEVEHVVCWQVVDTETGEVVWTLADSADSLQAAFTSLSKPANAEVVEWDVGSAAVSGDGTLVALLLTVPERGQVFVVNIHDKSQPVQLVGPPTKVGQMRWGTQR